MSDKILKNMKITPEQGKLYKEWFHGRRDGVEVGKGGPVVVGPSKASHKEAWFYGDVHKQMDKMDSELEKASGLMKELDKEVREK